MKRQSPTSQRVYRELTPQEQRQLAIAREETEAARDRIVAAGRVRKQAWEAMRRDAAETIAALKAERERLGETAGE